MAILLPREGFPGGCELLATLTVDYVDCLWIKMKVCMKMLKKRERETPRSSFRTIFAQISYE